MKSSRLAIIIGIILLSVLHEVVAQSVTSLFKENSLFGHSLTFASLDCYEQKHCQTFRLNYDQQSKSLQYVDSLNAQLVYSAPLHDEITYFSRILSNSNGAEALAISNTCKIFRVKIDLNIHDMIIFEELSGLSSCEGEMHSIASLSEQIFAVIVNSNNKETDHLHNENKNIAMNNVENSHQSIYFTKNGGETWMSPKRFNDRNGNEMHNIEVINVFYKNIDILIAMTRDGSYYITRNGGLEWFQTSTKTVILMDANQLYSSINSPLVAETSIDLLSLEESHSLFSSSQPSLVESPLLHECIMNQFANIQIEKPLFFLIDKSHSNIWFPSVSSSESTSSSSSSTSLPLSSSSSSSSSLPFLSIRYNSVNCVKKSSENNNNKNHIRITTATSTPTSQPTTMLSASSSGLIAFGAVLYCLFGGCCCGAIYYLRHRQMRRKFNIENREEFLRSRRPGRMHHYNNNNNNNNNNNQLGFDKDRMLEVAAVSRLLQKQREVDVEVDNVNLTMATPKVTSGEATGVTAGLDGGEDNGTNSGTLLGNLKQSWAILSADISNSMTSMVSSLSKSKGGPGGPVDQGHGNNGNSTSEIGDDIESVIHTPDRNRRPNRPSVSRDVPPPRVPGAQGVGPRPTGIMDLVHKEPSAFAFQIPSKTLRSAARDFSQGEYGGQGGLEMSDLYPEHTSNYRESSNSNGGRLSLRDLDDGSVSRRPPPPPPGAIRPGQGGRKGRGNGRRGN